MFCSTINQQVNEENEEIEQKEEVHEEVVTSAAHLMQSSLIKICRTGFRLTESGSCRKIIKGGSGTTERP